MLHYYPRHVSSIHAHLQEDKFYSHSILCESAFNRCTVQPFTDSDNTRCCENKICPPEDGHEGSKHVEDSSVTYILLMNKELCIKVRK